MQLSESCLRFCDDEKALRPLNFLWPSLILKFNIDQPGISFNF